MMNDDGLGLAMQLSAMRDKQEAIEKKLKAPSMVDMLLRDYFAATALNSPVPMGCSPSRYEQAARDAYAMADAMMKVRSE